MAAVGFETDDLCAPGATTESPAELAARLKTRFLHDQIYTALGSSALVCLNPLRSVQANADSELFAYLAESWTIGNAEQQTPLPPHVWQLAARAYFIARRTGQDQTIVVSGATGSGKSECRRLAIRALCETAAPPPGKRGSKLVLGIPAAEFVLDCFGHASTSTGANTSQFGRYSEIQYGDKHRLCGYKTLNYHLDARRVTSPAKGERNFHVVHYLVAGASGEEAVHLHLENAGATGLRYLAGTGAPTATDYAKFAKLKQAFKAVGFPQRAVSSVFQILAAILHLGQIDFIQDRTRNEDAAVVSNTPQLDLTASLLGVSAAALESALNVSTRLIGNDRVTSFHDAEGCKTNADELARCLYRLLFSWISEYISKKLSTSDFASFVSVLDFPGPRIGAQGDLNDLIFNLANERLHSFALGQALQTGKADAEEEGVAGLFPGMQGAFSNNTDCIRMLTSRPGGVIRIIDDQACRVGKTEATMLDALSKRWGNHANFTSKPGDTHSGRPGLFTITHYQGEVSYSTDGLLETDRAAISIDFVAIFAGSGALDGSSGGTSGSSIPLLQQLFAREADEARSSAKEGVGRSGTLRARPSIRRKPSTVGAKADDASDKPAPGLKGDTRCFLGNTNADLDILVESVRETRLWQILCLRPNDKDLPNSVDLKSLRAQIAALQIIELSGCLRGQWQVLMSHQDVWDRFSKSEPYALDSIRLGGTVWREKMLEIRHLLGCHDTGFVIGRSKVFLSFAAFKGVEDLLRSADENEVKMAKTRAQQQREAQNGLLAADPFSPFASASMSVDLPNLNAFASSSSLALSKFHADAPYSDVDTTSNYFDDGASRFHDGATVLGSEIFQHGSEKGFHGYHEPLAATTGGATIEVEKLTATRKWWLTLTWMFTFWIPSPLLRWIGRMDRPDVRMAWREKLFINMMIWLLCASAIFVIVFLGDIICPLQHVYSPTELSDGSYVDDPNQELIAIRGEVFDLSGFAPQHSPSIVSVRSIQRYGGLDATDLFPVQVSALCQGVGGSINPFITLNVINNTDPNAQYHDFRASASTTDYRPDWYEESMIYLRSNYRVGFRGWTTSDVVQLSQIAATRNTVIYGNEVYDMTSYILNGGGEPKSPPGTSPPIVSATDRAFMDPGITQIFATNGGNDVTSLINALNLGADAFNAQLVCLRNLFFVGKVDTRNSPRCQFARWILLAMSILIVSIIGFKFFAALNFSRSRRPEDFDKFVICQVPCYTEGEESLRKCLNSLTATEYDDKRKLLLVIVDGNIVGMGNDKSTPRIVLDILGVDPAIDPEPLSFQSVGEGARQHNMAKVYSGLYEALGHVVPYMVIVKLLVMRWLNRITYNTPMNPLELEMFHHLKNVIGVQPSFYEYLLSVDADTVVAPDSLSRLVASAMRDRKTIGLCGETTLANARHSWITAMQVYEYWISHHLTKAFESLFASVTCLPGCFTLFRVRTLEGKALFCSNEVLDAFSLNRVDTLHLKNLLHLGEDRFLTTVLLSHFPTYKTVFCRDARAQTIAPEEWRILLSQRRRWINSTVHNLAELLWIDRLCGFCCFSMRFIVLVDLFSTLVAPVTVAYVVYLIYTLATSPDSIPIFAFLILAAIYGLQALLFIVKRAFDMVGWMVIYILALPMWSLFIPLYSFWRQDDFRWGSTRLVTGETGKRVIMHEEGTFVPSEIPLQLWQDHEQQSWEKDSNQSLGGRMARPRPQQARDTFLYGRQSTLDLFHTFPPAGRSPAPSIRSSPPQPRSPVAGTRSSMHSIPPTLAPSHQARPSLMSQASIATYLSGGTLMPEREAAAVDTGHGHFQQISDDVDTETLLHDAPYHQTQSALPSDAQILHDIQRIVSTSDLDMLSKKTLRAQLEEEYGAPLGDKVGWVNQAIEHAAMSM